MHWLNNCTTTTTQTTYTARKQDLLQDTTTTPIRLTLTAQMALLPMNSTQTTTPMESVAILVGTILAFQCS